MTPPSTVEIESAAEVLKPLRHVCIAFLVINTVFLVFRFVAVLFFRPKRLALTWDDYFLIPAYILTLGMIVNGLVIHKNASNPIFSADYYMVHPAAIPVLKAGFAMTQLVTPAFAFTRFSILALFIRIFYRPYVRRISYFLIAFVVVQVLVFNITAAVQCLPSNYYWDRINYGMYGGPGRCLNLDRFYITFQGPEMFVDLVCILLPLPEIWKLQSSRGRKIGLTTLFLTGIIALMANCFRQWVFVKNPVTAFTPRMTNNTQMWTVAEPSICFVAACLPAMHPLAKGLYPSVIKARLQGRPMRLPERLSQQPLRSMSEGRQRLMDLEERAGTPASIVRPGTAGGYEAKAARVGVSHEIDTSALPSVPLEDWRHFKYGQGVLVRREITVTQEDLIEDILGF